jgi:hypothetical protein
VKLFRFVLLVLFLSSIYAKDKVRTGYFHVVKEVSLRDFLIKELGLPKSYIDKKFIQQVLKDNPRIRDAKKVSVGQKVYLSFPAKFKIKKQRRIVKKELFEYGLAKRKSWAFTGFYTLSFGTYDQKFSGGSAESKQNSPFTLGVGASYNYSKKYSFSTSAYVSYLTGSSNAARNADISVPPELGLTAYTNFKTKSSITPYLGADFESLSTFNIDELSSGKDLDTVDHKILYATAGCSVLLRINKKVYFAKLSISQSLMSDNDLKGQKAILFASIPLYERWSGHGFIKKHMLSGNTEVDINRVGFGIGYSFR